MNVFNPHTVTTELSPTVSSIALVILQATVGGCVFVDGPTLIISNSSFSHSVASTGGAIYVRSNSVSIEKAFFSLNEASENGGAIAVVK